ncbi:uncharacterized protein LOC119509982 [Choloepus didactylus]|uniref:uncharacterized protein LOC119509982 n=1 Tax=Choloepus didactylus TaxID=27675 RepID=UPI00189DD4B4|nr:uncharacterized protein LOC119509982 [Choloepus didactylus]
MRRKLPATVPPKDPGTLLWQVEMGVCLSQRHETLLGEKPSERTERGPYHAHDSPILPRDPAVVCLSPQPGTVFRTATPEPRLDTAGNGNAPTHGLYTPTGNKKAEERARRTDDFQEGGRKAPLHSARARAFPAAAWIWQWNPQWTGAPLSPESPAGPSGEPQAARPRLGVGKPPCPSQLRQPWGRPQDRSLILRGEREEKCIMEDIPSDTLITGTFKVQKWDIGRHDFLESAPGLGMFVTVTTYNDEVLLSKLYGPQGTFYFTSHSSGEHIICLTSNSTKIWSFGGSDLRVHLDIRVGEHDLDAAMAQAKDKVNEVRVKLEHLIEQMQQIVKEQNYQRDREENFRMTSEDTNGNVLCWALAQTLILISVGLFQMKYLKDFFIAKKLV